jgi:hypothetical protein
LTPRFSSALQVATDQIAPATLHHSSRLVALAQHAMLRRSVAFPKVALVARPFTAPSALITRLGIAQRLGSAAPAAAAAALLSAPQHAVTRCHVRFSTALFASAGASEASPPSSSAAAQPAGAANTTPPSSAAAAQPASASACATEQSAPGDQSPAEQAKRARRAKVENVLRERARRVADRADAVRQLESLGQAAPESAVDSERVAKLRALAEKPLADDDEAAELYALLSEVMAENSTLEREIAKLKREIATLESRVATLEGSDKIKDEKIAALKSDCAELKSENARLLPLLDDREQTVSTLASGERLRLFEKALAQVVIAKLRAYAVVVDALAQSHKLHRFERSRVLLKLLDIGEEIGRCWEVSDSSQP